MTKYQRDKIHMGTYVSPTPLSGLNRLRCSDASRNKRQRSRQMAQSPDFEKQLH